MGHHYILSCEKCGEIRYRTKTPMPERSKLVASDFVPVNGGPPLVEGATCYACSGRLRAGRDASTNTVEEPQSRVFDAPRELGNTLFEVQNGEEVRDMQSRGDGLLIITNKRVVYLDLRALEASHV